MAMIPAMTTGMTLFMMNSGRITAMAEMPQPDFAVPYAAPNAETQKQNSFNAHFRFVSFDHRPLKTTAAVAPIAPKKAEYAGHLSVTVDDMTI